MSSKLSLSLITAIALTAAAGGVAHAQSMGTTNFQMGIGQPGAPTGTFNSQIGTAQPGASMGTTNSPTGIGQPGAPMGTSNSPAGIGQPGTSMGPPNSQTGSLGSRNLNSIPNPNPVMPSQPATQFGVPGTVR